VTQEAFPFTKEGYAITVSLFGRSQRKKEKNAKLLVCVELLRFRMEVADATVKKYLRHSINTKLS
jgi:hypothetical protein